MPLIHGKSNKAFVHNLKAEMHAGKPQKQSLAIAYALKRKAGKKMAEGGESEFNKEEMKEMPLPMHDRIDLHEVGKHKAKEHMSKRERAIAMFEGGQIKDNYQSSKDSHITHPDMGYHEKDEYDPKEEPGRRHDEPASEEDSLMLNQHGAHEVGPEGSTVDAQDHEKVIDHAVENQDHDSEALDMVGRIMKQRAQVYAEGGETHMCSGSGCSHYSHGGMAKKHHYSEGGKVANEDLPIIDDMPAEYDDLHLRDDLHSSYTGANSGDEIGNDRLDHDEEDIVSRIMKSRKKKDRMPVPA